MANHSSRQGDNTIKSPPPVHQPMLPAEAKASPQTITVTPLPQLTENPTWIDCPYCNQRTKTLVTSEAGSAQWFVPPPLFVLPASLLPPLFVTRHVADRAVGKTKQHVRGPLLSLLRHHHRLHTVPLPLVRGHAYPVLGLQEAGRHDPARRPRSGILAAIAAATGSASGCGAAAAAKILSVARRCEGGSRVVG